jgi:hypothetical protein
MLALYLAGCTYCYYLLIASKVFDFFFFLTYLFKRELGIKNEITYQDMAYFGTGKLFGKKIAKIVRLFIGYFFLIYVMLF